MTIIILVAIIAILVLWFISVQRKLVVMDENINNSMSQIGVQLSSRWDALTALLDLTKGYAEHEYKTISDTIKMRTSINAKSTAADVNAQENILTEAMGKIMAVAEATAVDTVGNMPFAVTAKDIYAAILAADAIGRTML